jgi:hypothetical protein
VPGGGYIAPESDVGLDPDWIPDPKSLVPGGFLILEADLLCANANVRATSAVSQQLDNELRNVAEWLHPAGALVIKH